MKKQPMYLIDARKSPKHREVVDKIIKIENARKGSKYMKPSFSGNGLSYQVSHKG